MTTSLRPARPVIIGAGLAGLMTALELSPVPVIVLCSGALGEGASSVWAQGGVATCMGPDDSPLLHTQDTLVAGDGLSEDAATAAIIAQGPDAIERLSAYGVVFDRDPSGMLKLGLEAAHRRRRIVHAHGDGTGREIMRALIARARQTPSIELMEHTRATRLATNDHGAIAGVEVQTPQGAAFLPSSQVVIATGGVGGLFLHTTNPLGACGLGLALALQAGAMVMDPEFVQFHPTALAAGRDPMPLVSEAVRGEGAILVDETGRRFMRESPYPGEELAELAPRDVVARAIWRQLQADHRVFLDARSITDFHTRFPSITALCLDTGIDPATQPIPVRPAAHYHMGGIEVDHDGRTSVPGLWACGEASATGLHGANRLASNSLLEAAVCGTRVARDIAGQATSSAKAINALVASVPAVETSTVRPIMSRAVGVLREEHTLRQAVTALLPMATGTGPASAPASAPAMVGLAMATAALQRCESRGGHCRTDAPDRLTPATHTRLTLAELLPLARSMTLPRSLCAL